MGRNSKQNCSWEHPAATRRGKSPPGNPNPQIRLMLESTQVLFTPVQISPSRLAVEQSSKVNMLHQNHTSNKIIITFISIKRKIKSFLYYLCFQSTQNKVCWFHQRRLTLSLILESRQLRTLRPWFCDTVFSRS